MATLNWIGKDAVVNHDKDVPFKLLKKIKEISTGDRSQNLIIHGDNLEALKALMPYYGGRIKCIYIDPPYNTGDEGWVYNDKVNSPKIKQWLGKVVGRESEDLTRHDKWLCMMYPRLKLLYDLLSDDGVIFVSIDDNEQHHLRGLMDEIFGEAGFSTTLIWNKQHSQQQGAFKRYHDFILVYSKGKLKAFGGGDGEILAGAMKKISSRNPASNFEFPKGTRIDSKDRDFPKKWGDVETVEVISGKMVVRNGRLAEKVVLSAGWTQKNQMKQWFYGDKTNLLDSRGQKILEFFFNSEGKLKIRKARERITPSTVLNDIGTQSAASAELAEIFNGKLVFDRPKPSKLIKKLIGWVVSTDKDAIVLDSFAGSGTTAHAVMDLNNDEETGGNRKFILIEMEDAVARAVTAERVKRTIKLNGYQDSFEFCELDKPLFDENGQIEESCDFMQFATYIYFTETQTNIDEKKIDGSFIGEDRDTEYYLLYRGRNKNDLNKSALKALSSTSRKKIVYADRCLLDSETLERRGIVFKQIPYEVKVY